MFSTFENLRQFYIDKDKARDNPYKALFMDSPQQGMMQTIHFDFDSISYFLDQDGDICSMTLMELQLLDWHYQLISNTAELRAKAFDELHKMFKETHLSIDDYETIKALYFTDYNKLDLLTDQFIELVDEGINITKLSYSQMQAALKEQFSNQAFLQINFEEKP
jgi:hypothetical protein